MFLYGIPAVWETFRVRVTPHILPVLIPLTQVALTGMTQLSPHPASFPYIGSVYCVVVVAIERYFSVCRPFEQKVIIEFGTSGKQYCLDQWMDVHLQCGGFLLYV